MVHCVGIKLKICAQNNTLNFPPPSSINWHVQIPSKQFLKVTPHLICSQKKRNSLFSDFKRYHLIQNGAFCSTNHPTPFSIDALLQKAKIPDDKLPLIQKFLEWANVDQTTVQSVTKETLGDLVDEYNKKENPQFRLGLYAGQIVEAAAYWQKVRLSSSRTEGISITDQVISFRETTISDLDNLLDKYHLCLIQAPPYTGKTTIGQLLARHVQRKGHTAVRLSTLGKGSKYNDIEECWIRKTNRSWTEWFKATTPTTLIIDEAQIWYDYGHGHPFWQDVKEEKQCPNPNLRILFISAYGERPQAKSGPANMGTPIDFSEEETLNFSFIRLTRKEFDELVSSQNQSSESTVLLSKNVANVIYNMTLGHAGLTKKTVKLIERNFHQKEGDSAPSDADVVEYLLSRTYYDYICRTRAVPERVFTKDEERVLREIILAGYAQPLDKKVATELLKSGLVADIEGRLEFAAPILKIIFIERLYGSKRAEKGPTNFEGFIADCIHRLNRNILKESFSRRDIDAPLYERQWQMEFYRAAASLLTDKQVISADVGAIFGSEGKLDFYLNGNLKWAIELLREGDDALEHAQRFQEGGDYWVMREKIHAYALLDFRSSKPRAMKDNFWYLIYENFEKITIRRKGRDDVVVPLL